MTKEADSVEQKSMSTGVKVGIGFGIAVGVAAIASFVIFRMLNRIKVEGLENIPAGHQNVLYCLNHTSLLDNFAFETTVYMPKLLFEPEYLPVNLADRKNFFGDPQSRKLKDRVLRILGKHFFSHLRAYPVDRNRGDLEQVDKWIELLKDNIVVVFPEGTRTRSGKMGRGKPGVGKMIYMARPTVIPVRMSGVNDILAVGKIIPRAFQTVNIIIGKPVQLDDLLDRPLPEDLQQQKAFFAEISDRVVDVIKSLKPQKT
ncbi:MAG: lysophospholipid acyltransferase family protein [Acidobacteriota bacterium]|nr:1-acyl-sn-glycerol-3-phosphate acyltransferase [Blastocatellia bacterium]MDW8411602.1 lysophospholipid acyltransferase family protein [Acidobacteriota bacterium]